MYVILKVKIDISNIAILNTIKYSKIFLSVFFHMRKSVQKTITDIFISESVKINFEKKLTLPFSVNLTTFFSATFSFLSGGVMSILERPFLRGDRCDILWLLCVGTTDSSSLSLSSEADLKINVIMRWLRELVI